MERYNVEFSAMAEDDLFKIAEIIFEVSRSAPTAMRFVKELRQSVSHLSEFPESGKLFDMPNYDLSGIRYLICREYLLFYMIDDLKKRILILAVIDGRREYIEVLNKRL